MTNFEERIENKVKGLYEFLVLLGLILVIGKFLKVVTVPWIVALAPWYVFDVIYIILWPVGKLVDHLHIGDDE